MERVRVRHAVGAVVVSLLIAAFAAAPAGAASKRTVKCTGTANFCGATVKLAGGASNVAVTVNLTDTDFTLVGVRVIPGSSRGSYNLSHKGFALGGSVYHFTLNAASGNPSNARIILLFAAGRAG